MFRLKPGTVLKHRVLKSGLKKPFTDETQAVERVCGVQAQVLKAAMISALVRTEGRTIKDIEGTLWKDNDLTKTWCMRGTLHLLPSEELSLYAHAFGNRKVDEYVGYLKTKGFSKEKIERMKTTVKEIVDVKPLTKNEIADLWGSRGISATDPFGVLLKICCFEGTIKFGPQRGVNVTFVRVEKEDDDITEQEALTRVFTKYMDTYGPSTPQDFAYWSGLKVSQGRELFVSMKDTISKVKVGDEEMWMLQGNIDDIKEYADDSVKLLPYFDTYLLSHKDKGLIIDDEHYKRVYRQAGWIYPTLLINGGVEGTWSYELSEDRFEVTVEPFGKIVHKDEIDRECIKMARAMGKKEHIVHYT